jgi:polysaccharide chain length determinant protein (PEP-CTERM system associated)
MATQKSILGPALLQPLSIARMVWKRKVLILMSWAIVSLSAALFVYRLPTLYSAEALILVDAQKIPEKFVTSTVSTDVQDRLATISQQILSSTRLKKIIDDFDLYRDGKKSAVQEEILEMMRGDISIKLERGWVGNRPGAFRIAYKGSDPAIVAQVANRITNLFIEENLKTREVQAEGTSEFIDTQLQESKKRLDELESAVSDYKLKHNGELPQQESAISGVLSRLTLQLQTNRDSLERAEQSKAVLDNTLKATEAAVTVLKEPPAVVAGTESPVVAPNNSPQPTPPKKASELMEAQLDVLRGRYSDDYPDVRRLRSEIARVKAIEEKEATPEAVVPSEKAPVTAKPQTARPSSIDQRRNLELGMANERVSAIKLQLSAADREIENRKKEQQQLVSQMAVAEGRLSRLPVREQEMSRITRDYEISKANYRSLLDKKLSAEMSTDMERRQKSERFTVVDPARVPEKPFSPNRPMFWAIGAVAGLLIGLAAGFVMELRANVILGEWELPAGVPVLGRLPFIDVVVMNPCAGPTGAGRRWLPQRKLLRLALVSSAVFSVLGIVVAGVYLLRSRF